MTLEIVPDAARDSALSALVMAFSADPLARWVYPDSGRYLRCFPRFIELYCGRAFDNFSAWRAGEVGAALWLPPGEEPDQEALLRHVRRTVSADRQPDLLSLLEQTGRARPRQPHWYLPMIGVDPAMQRRGFGSALLEMALRLVDHDRLPAYLEMTNPKYIALCERHGFRRMGVIREGDAPPLYPMIREVSVQA